MSIGLSKVVTDSTHENKDWINMASRKQEEETKKLYKKYQKQQQQNWLGKWNSQIRKKGKKQTNIISRFSISPRRTINTCINVRTLKSLFVFAVLDTIYHLINFSISFVYRARGIRFFSSIKYKPDSLLYWNEIIHAFKSRKIQDNIKRRKVKKREEEEEKILEAK